MEKNNFNSNYIYCFRNKYTNVTYAMCFTFLLPFLCMQRKIVPYCIFEKKSVPLQAICNSWNMVHHSIFQDTKHLIQN